MSNTALESYSLQELSKELNRRVLKGSSVKGTPATKSLPGGTRDFSSHPTMSIVNALKEKQKVIYGTDDRKDVYEVHNKKYLKAAQSVVALFKSSQIKDLGNGKSKLSLENFGEANNLCPGEKFRNQPIGAFCSGFLVAPQIICTAGHCAHEKDVKDIRFVFGFKMINAKKATTTINNSDIYAGISLIGRKQVDDGPDWALVKIDRPVKGHPIVKIRRSGKIKDDASLYIIGHPCGLPMKVAPNAVVRDNTKPDYCVCTTDSYGGNSGSPVFAEGETDPFVEGILVRGETDFKSVGNCNVSLVCPTTGCRGEDITRTRVIANLVPK